MSATMTCVVTAEIWYDACHVVDYDIDLEEDIEEGRWIVSINAPGGVEVTRIAKTPSACVKFIDQWGRDRGVYVNVRFLHSLGGPA